MNCVRKFMTAWYSEPMVMELKVTRPTSLADVQAFFEQNNYGIVPVNNPHL
jgi:hypothetical protein